MAIINDVQSQVDQEIDTCQEDEALMRRHDAISFISQLPPEILINVFQFVRLLLLEEWEKIDCSKRHFYFDLMDITRVCSHWRAIAIHCPSLWDCIFVPALTLAGFEELLRRSEQVPLTAVAYVYVQALPPQNGMKELSTLWTHIPRIRQLRILAKGEGENATTWLNECLSDELAPAPILETFALSSDVIADRRFPDDFFAGEVPALRQLELSNCPVNWESPVFKQLQLLTISFGSQWDGDPSLSQILNFLRNLPNLEVLELNTTFPKSTHAASAQPVASHRTILLPHLRYFSVGSTFFDCSPVLNQLCLPSLGSLKLCLGCYEMDPHHFSSIVPTLSYWDSLGQHPPITHLLCESTFDGAEGLKFSTFDCVGRDNLSPAESGLEVQLIDLFDTTDHVGIVRSVSKLLSLQNLEYLCITEIGQLTEDIWVDCFGRLPQLKTLSVVNHFNRISFPLFLALSMTSTSTPAEHLSTSLYFPALCELHIESWRFKDAIFKCLKGCLQIRRAFQVGIQILCLKSCLGLPRARIGRLKAIIPHVVHDISDWHDEDAYFLSPHNIEEMESSDSD